MRFRPLTILVELIALVISPTTFRDIVSGRRRGLAARAARLDCAAASVPYGWVVRRRNRRYDRGAAEIHRAGRAGGQRRQSHRRRHGQDADGRVDRPAVAQQRRARGDPQPRLRRRSRRPQRRGPGARARAARRAALAESRPGRVGARSPSRNWRRSCWCSTTASSIGGWRAISTSCCSTPASRLASTTCCRAARCASRSRDCGRAQVVVLSRADMLDAAAREAVRRRVRGAQPARRVVRSRAPARGAAGVRRRDASRWTTCADSRWRRSAASATRRAFATRSTALGCRVAAWREFPDHHAYTRDGRRRACRAGRASAAPSWCSARARIW